MSHSRLTGEIILAANKYTNIKCWSNPVGLAYNGHMIKTFVEKGIRYGIIKNPTPVKYGLCKGSNDIIGFRKRILKGERFAQFIGMEIKTPEDITRKHQKNFIDMINISGGISGVVRSVEDIKQFIV